MKNLAKLRRELTARKEEARAILDVQETRADHSLTAEEDTRFKALETEVSNRSTEIEREQRFQDAEANTARAPGAESVVDETREFGEFLQEARFNPGNSSLERRDVTMGDGPSAGFMVPEKYDTAIREVTPQEAIFRPRCTVIPGGDAPDAAINLLTADQSGTRGVYNGVTVSWVAETGTRQDGGDPKLINVKLEPKEVSAYIDVSDKLFRNAPAVGGWVTNLLKGAITGCEEDAFFTGSGVGKPKGIVGHGCVKTISRGTVNTFKWSDAVKFAGAFKFGKSAVWIVNQTVLPQMMVMEDTNGNALWMPNAAVGIGGVFMGFPVLINDLAPALGTEGDVMLADLSYYLIKDGSPLAIFIDPYTQKVNGITRIYAFWNVDGQPQLTTPIKMRGSSETVSPFVILK
jgi:HK97 family phage major capsid protein